MGGSWRKYDSLGGYRKVLKGLLWFRKVKVQRKSRKVLDGLKKHGESGTVLYGPLRTGRVSEGSLSGGSRRVSEGLEGLGRSKGVWEDLNSEQA